MSGNEHKWHQALRDQIAHEYGEPEHEGEHNYMAAEQACSFYEEALGYTDESLDDAGLLGMYEAYLAFKWLDREEQGGRFWPTKRN